MITKIIIADKNENGDIILSEEKMLNLINDIYNIGYSDGKSGNKKSKNKMGFTDLK